MLSMKTLTDDMLVASYAQGNNEAFDELLARHQARIFNYILMMVKDEDVANDIFQDKSGDYHKARTLHGERPLCCMAYENSAESDY